MEGSYRFLLSSRAKPVILSPSLTLRKGSAEDLLSFGERFLVAPLLGMTGGLRSSE
jgi:hypothetical protein